MACNLILPRENNILNKFRLQRKASIRIRELHQVGLLFRCTGWGSNSNPPASIDANCFLINFNRQTGYKIDDAVFPPRCPQILTKDSVTVSVDAVVYYRIQNPMMSVINIEDAPKSTRFLAQTTLRNLLGTKTLSEILTDRDHISTYMQVRRQRHDSATTAPRQRRDSVATAPRQRRDSAATAPRQRRDSAATAPQQLGASLPDLLGGVKFGRGNFFFYSQTCTIVLDINLADICNDTIRGCHKIKSVT